MANKDYVSVAKSDDDTITGFTMSNSAKFYEFQAEPQSIQFLQEEQTGNPNKYFNQTLNFTLTNINQEKKNVLKALGLSKISAIVQYPNGTYKLAGEYGDGLLAATLSIDSGTAIGDLAAATISLVGGSIDLANEVTSAAVTAVID